MAFKDIKGQSQAIECLRNAVNRSRLAHAYLFLGRRGLGKTMLAQNLAKFLNCSNPQKEQQLPSDCCDHCSSCRKIDHFNHPDVHWIESENSRKISIDQIRSAQQKIYLKPYEAKFKVFIILQAEQLTEQAANSLLKTLEEPPEFSLIILTAQSTSALLSTIISRCQLINFFPLAAEQIQQVLISQYKLDPAQAQFLAAQAEGRIGRALNLKEEKALDKKNRLLEQIGNLNNNQAADELFNIKDKAELAKQLAYLINWFRDILVFKLGLDQAQLINADRIPYLKSWAPRFALTQLQNIVAQIDQAHRLIEQNVNPRIALEVMLEEIAQCKR